MKSTKQIDIPFLKMYIFDSWSWERINHLFGIIVLVFTKFYDKNENNWIVDTSSSQHGNMTCNTTAKLSKCHVITFSDNTLTLPLLSFKKALLALLILIRTKNPQNLLSFQVAPINGEPESRDQATMAWSWGCSLGANSIWECIQLPSLFPFFESVLGLTNISWQCSVLLMILVKTLDSFLVLLVTSSHLRLFSWLELLLASWVMVFFGLLFPELFCICLIGWWVYRFTRVLYFDCFRFFYWVQTIMDSFLVFECLDWFRSRLIPYSSVIAYV